MFRKILSLFLVWRIGLFLTALLASFIIPVYGNSFPYANVALQVTNLPNWVWGFGGFDGVHYLRIAQNGYNAEFSQAFFPLYPVLINIFNVLPKNLTLDTRIFVDPTYFYIAFLISNIFLIASLWIFYKLTRIDFNHKIATGSMILLLSFPTAFYFGAIYTESLFLFLILCSFYFARTDKFILAGIIGALASATRIFGLLLVPALILEVYLKVKSREIKLKSKEFIKAVIGILIAPAGTIIYMWYLKINFSNPLYFLTSQPSFGAERSSTDIILLPQVFYRYIKIFATVPLQSHAFFSAALEFIFSVVILIAVILLFKKIRLSYFIFIIGCLIIPTLTGTLSSMPRYVLMSFLAFPLIVSALGNSFKYLLFSFIILQIVLLSLFIRGYWVA